MKLSILIPTVASRKNELSRLLSVLNPQITKFHDLVELKIDDSAHPITTGRKRNSLLQKSTGQYVVYIDDDDMVPTYYVQEMLTACSTNADCVAINGVMTTDGKNRTRWLLSKKYENRSITEIGETILLRKTNHITAVRRELAIKVGFPDKSHAEDKYYSDRVATLCQTETVIQLPMYHYQYCSKNKLYV